MDFDSYLKIDRVNWSTLSKILVSPKQYRHALANPPTVTPAMALGSAVHCAILEPDVLPTRYAVLDADQIAEIAPPRNTSAGKRVWGEYLGSHLGQPGDVSSAEYQRLMVAAAMPGKEIVTAAVYAQCLAIRDAVHGHPAARALVTGEGTNEHSVTWTDRLTGIECKGRLDRLHGNPRTILDVKTCRTVTPRSFGAAAYGFGYHRQMAFYSSAFEGADIPCVLLAVESAPPHDVAVFTLDEDTIEAGRADVRVALDTLARCRETNEWPGQCPVAMPLMLPRYAFPEYDVDDLMIGGDDDARESVGAK